MLKYNRLVMNLGANGRLRFGDCEVDSHAGKLFRDGLPVKLQPQPFRVLTILLEQPGEIVSREQLRERVWGDATFVEFDQGLNYCIRQVRRALRDGALEPVYIETLPKQGYRFHRPGLGFDAGAGRGGTTHDFFAGHFFAGHFFADQSKVDLRRRRRDIGDCLHVPLRIFPRPPRSGSIHPAHRFHRFRHRSRVVADGRMIAFHSWTKRLFERRPDSG